jgi:hypothetical protein
MAVEDMSSPAQPEVWIMVRYPRWESDQRLDSRLLRVERILI